MDIKDMTSELREKFKHGVIATLQLDQQAGVVTTNEHFANRITLLFDHYSESLLSQAYTQGKEDERKELLQWVFDILKDEEVKLMSQGGLYNEIRNELKKEIRSKILKRMKGNIDN